jgi:translation initiation factor IF-3
LGVKPLPDALLLARSLDLDLVEVAPMANPPVCRIMDYGKFRYEESQKAKESRKKTVHVSIKEVKFRPKIGKGDFDTKVRHMHDFLAEGHKVKVTLQFRGREMAHPELGSKILDAVLDQLGPGAKVETQARLEGRNMTMVLAPEKKAAPPKSRDRRDDTDADDDTGSATTETTVDAGSTTVDTTSADTTSAGTNTAESPIVDSPVVPAAIEPAPPAAEEAPPATAAAPVAAAPATQTPDA